MVLLVDALRPDHLGCYGYTRPVSPFIDQVACEGTLFRKAFVHSTHTLPSTACLLTGTSPPVNGMHKYIKAVDDEGHIISDTLDKSNVTLAELLKDKGYKAGAFSANGLLSEDLGFAQGFEPYRIRGGNAADVNHEAIEWLESLNTRPYFCYIHYMDIHSPYKPPFPYNRLYQPVEGNLYTLNGMPGEEVREDDLLYNISQYDGQINYIDNQIRLLWLMLDERGLLDNTLMVILADHGEELMEHGGFGHGTTLFEELLRIPLIFWYPGVIPSGVVREEMVSHSDVFPTLASFAGAGLAGLPVSGKDLFSAGSAPGNSKSVYMHYAEIFYYKRGYDIKAVRTCREKLIITTGKTIPPIKEYYDLISDPSEQMNLYHDEDKNIKLLEAHLLESAERGEHTRSKGMPLDKKAIKELKSLGYLE